MLLGFGGSTMLKEILLHPLESRRNAQEERKKLAFERKLAALEQERLDDTLHDYERRDRIVPMGANHVLVFADPTIREAYLRVSPIQNNGVNTLYSVDTKLVKCGVDLHDVHPMRPPYELL